MIEVIYKDEKQTAKGNEESFNLPKNIRQIGIPNEKYRIYIEDYVYTFLKKIAEKAEEEEKKALLEKEEIEEDIQNEDLSINEATKENNTEE